MNTRYEINVSPEERGWLIRRFMEILLDRFGADLTSVVLYGSTARGTPRPDSDVDLLLVIRNIPGSQLERSKQLSPLCDSANRAFEDQYGKFPPYLSLIEKSDEEAVHHSLLYLDMLEDGKILFDLDGFIAGVFPEMRAKLSVLGAHRVWIGDKWYWDLKPDYRFGDVFEM